MTKIKSLFITSIMVLGMFALSGGTAEVSAQGSQDFMLVNKTGIEIYALYVTPHSAKEWGEDILGVDTLAAGETLDITFSRKERAKLWDLRIEDEDGNSIEWENINLLEIASVTLYYNNKKATAIFDDYVYDLSGTWVGYYDDGTRSPYVWNIRQTGANLMITDAKGGKTKSRGTVAGKSVRALDFATQNGKLSNGFTRINWSDGVVWVKQ